MAAPEETIFRTIDLPPGGPDYRFFPEFNVVAFRRGLTCAGKLMAMDELQREWRRAHLSVVQSA